MAEKSMVAKLVLDASSYKTGIDSAVQLTKQANKEMELWKVQNNAVAGSAKALAKELETQKSVMTSLNSQISLTEKQLKDVSDAKGVNSVAATKLKNNLLDMQIAQAKLSKEIVGASKPFQNFKNHMVDIEKGLKKAGDQMISAGKSLTMSITAPAIAAAAGILKLANDSAEYADTIGLMAEKTGMSTKSIQEMQYVTNQLDVDFSKVQASMTSFTARLKGLEEGSGDTVKSIKELGIATTDGGGKTRALNNIYMDTINKLSEMTNESDRNIMAAKIFGKSWAEVAPLMNAGSTEIERLKKQANDLSLVISDEGIASAREYGDMMDSLKMQFKAAATQIGVDFMPIIKDTLVPFIQNSVVPAIKSIVENVKGVIEWFKNLTPETQKIIGIMIGLFAAIGPIITVVGGIISSIGVLAPVLAALTGPVGLVIIAVTALVAGIMYLWKTNETFRDTVIKIWEGIKTAAISVFDGLKEFWNKWGGTITQMFSDIWEIIKTVAMTIFDNLKEFWNKWGGAITAAFTLIWDNIKTAFTAVWETIKNIVETAIKVVSNVIGLVLDLIKGDWSGAWDHVKNIGKTYWDFIIKELNIFKDFFVNIWNNLKNGVIEIVQGIWDGVVKIISDIIDWTVTALEKIGILNNTKIEDKSYTVTEIHKTINSSSSGTGGGSSGGSSGGGGGGGGGGAFSGSSNSGAAAAIAEMKANSKAWGDATASGKEILANENLQIGESLGLTRDDNGVWHDPNGTRAYAGGTESAAPGWAWTGEKGPELINFKGGEQVIPNNKLGGNTIINIPKLADSIVVRDNSDIDKIGEMLVRHLKSKGIRLATPY